MRLFLDSSMLLGFFTKDEDFRETALLLQAMSELGDAELWVSSESFVKVQRFLAATCDDQAIARAFAASLKFLNVCALDGDDIRRAAQAAKGDFDDCLIDVGAQKVKADLLLTRREEGYEDAVTLASTPEEFFEELDESGISYV